MYVWCVAAECIALTVLRFCEQAHLGALTSRYAGVKDEAEQIAEALAQYADGATDSGPVQQMRQALRTIRKEIADMDTRIAVSLHYIMQFRVRSSTAAAALSSLDSDSDIDV